MWHGERIGGDEIAATILFYDVALMDMETHQIIDRKQEEIEQGSPFQTIYSSQKHTGAVELEEWIKSEIAHKLVGIYSDGTLKVWEWHREKDELPANQDSLDEFQITPEEIEIPDQAPLYTIALDEKSDCTFFLPPNDNLVVVANQTLYIFDSQSGESVVVRYHVEHCPIVSPDGNIFAISYASDYIEFVNPVAGRFLGRIDLPKGSVIRGAVFSRDSQYAAIHTDKEVFIFNLNTVLIDPVEQDIEN